MKGLVDMSSLLGLGVYVLKLRGRVVHIGKARRGLEQIAKHQEFVSKEFPAWFPIKGIRFDEVLWLPSHPDRIDADFAKIEAELLALEAA